MQHARGLLDLPGDTFGHGGLVVQFVPENIYLVEGYEVRIALHCIHMVGPDLEIRLGDTGVGCQHEKDGLCIGQRVQRQLGFHAQGVQSGRVQHHQSLLEQRMRKIDDGVAPYRYFDHLIGRRFLSLRPGIIQTQFLRFADADLFRFGNFGQSLAHFLGGTQLQNMLCRPVHRRALVLGNGERGLARLDGQQLDAGPVFLVPPQFGRAHGRVTGRGGQETLLVIGKENRVQQFRLAA